MPALGLDFDRSLRAQPSEVRGAISATLREAGFQLTAEQLTRVEAKRGNRWLSGALMPARMMPILAWFDIAPDGAGCSVAGHLVDQHLNLGGKAWGLNQTYRQMFLEVLDSFDRALGRLDPQAAAGFPPARFWSKGGDIALLEQAQTKGVQAGATVFGKANEILEGGPRDRVPTAWKGVDAVTFSSSKGYAVVSLAETQAHLGVGLMIAVQAGSMPANLARDVEQFTTRVEVGLTGAQGRAVTIPVADGEVPVFEFLHQQVRIRDGLPVRTLNTCRTCHFQKVTNEDFARLQARNQRLRSLVGGVGATVSAGGIQPFVVIGQLFRLKKLDPDYICPRCQGLDADERVITFCPSCGEMRSEAVLRACAKCAHDFRTALPKEALWLTAEAAAALIMPSAPPPASGPTPAPGGWVMPSAPPPAAGPTPAPGGWVMPSAPPPAAGPTPAPGGWVMPSAPPPAAGPTPAPGGWVMPSAPPPAAGPTPAPGGWVMPSAPPPAAGPTPAPGGWVMPSAPPPAAGPTPAPGGWVMPSAPQPAAGPTPAQDAALAPVSTPGVDPDPPPATPVASPPPVSPVGVSSGPAEPFAFCPFCGTPIGPGFVFCPACGARLDAVTKQAGGPSA